MYIITANVNNVDKQMREMVHVCQPYWTFFVISYMVSMFTAAVLCSVLV